MKTFGRIALALAVVVGITTLVFQYLESKQTTQSPQTATKQETVKSGNSAENIEAILQTSKGTIKVKLFPNEAPEMVKNFTTLSQEKKYNDTIFHRVIEGFMIQGGDYENFNGTGGKAYNGSVLNDEISPNLSHVRGMVSMANRGPNTNGSQFFIVHQDAPHLDGGYSIFGQVISGMDVVDAITNSQTNINDKPLTDILLHSVIISEK